jgi:hypothetical protein
VVLQPKPVIIIVVRKGTTSVPTPVPQIANPEARPRWRLNQRCITPTDGTYIMPPPKRTPTP